mgnify:CR=1 FL=1
MTHNTREEEERFRNKILDVETAIRLTYNEKDSDQMVQKMLDFIHQELQQAREEVYKEVQANAERCCRDNGRGAFEPVKAVPLRKPFTN